MKTKQKVYLRILYTLILFIVYRLGNHFVGTPMNIYNYFIFTIIYFYYYLTDFLEFEYTGEKFRLWITSAIINILLSLFLWSFSKSIVLFYKFILFWTFSNILRILLSEFNKNKIKGGFVGSKKRFEEYDYSLCFKSLESLEYIGDFSKQEELLNYIERNGINLIIVEEEIAKKNSKEFLNLKLKGIKMFLPWQYRETVEKKIDVRGISENWFLNNQGFDILSDTFQRKIKRILDIVAAIIIGIFSAPIIALTVINMKILGILNKKNSGPIFFKQKRIGIKNEAFEIIKIRSMITKEHWAEVGFDPNKESWTEKNDPRITKFGVFLRKTRIDELPQLLNVLKGDMSFIGPRPESIEYVEVLDKEIPFYGLRHTVLPGLTGWAQVMYPYGASVEDALHKLEYDLYYIKHQTFMMDLMIFFKTIKIVVFGRGR